MPWKRIVIFSLLFGALIGYLSYDEPKIDGIPSWVIKGILWVESDSTITDEGIVYRGNQPWLRNKLTHAGCMQITRIAFRQVAWGGEKYEDLENDNQFCLEIGERYLRYLYNRDHSWERAVEAYHAGPGNRDVRYLNRVRRAAGYE